MSWEATTTINEKENKTMTRTELMIYAQQLYDSSLAKNNFKRYERLNRCQARILETESVVILKSYSTIVAIYNKRVGSIYVFNYYSATTVQHIYKFADLLDWDRIVFLYKRSDNVLELTKDYMQNRTMKPSKEEWENLYRYDFSMEITSKWD